MIVIWILLSVSIVASAIASTTNYQPQQVHIAFGGKFNCFLKLSIEVFIELWENQQKILM